METTARPRPKTQLTLLSSILGPDFRLALERQKAIDVTHLDLKDGLWGKTVETLSGGEAARAASLIAEHGLHVHCFSTSIGHTVLEPGTTEAAFRLRHEPALENAICAARILRPQAFRLLAPRVTDWSGENGAAEQKLRRFPWVMNAYRDWADRIADTAGCGVLIENEARGCLLASVSGIQFFFAALNRSAVRYTWDVQNLWQNGVFPTIETYRELQPLMGALHLKGGRAAQGADDTTLTWASPLDEASWPVLAIVRAVIADGVAPYICLNPSHGEKPPGWDVWQIAQRDAAFLRREIPEIA